MSHPRILLVAALLPPLVAGCFHRIPRADPAEIPRLEAALSREPGNPELLTRLGMAHFRAGNLSQAEARLGAAVATGEASGAAYLYLGLVHEAREEWGQARQAYSSYLERGRYGPLKEEIQKRLVLITRQELRTQARAALAREAELSATPPLQGSVAVFPFHVVTDNEDLLPLQVAMADMMTTDLALVRGLRVLERAQVQSLLTEMALTEAGLTQPETGARAGRLLRAEHVVQGALSTLPGENLRLDAEILHTVRGTPAGQASGQDALQRLFDLEKAAVFRILETLGVSLTPAEREAILNNRAANLLAFLAYGQGLMALDRGDYGAAQGYFRQALGLDPAFRPAAAAQVQAQVLQQAALTTPSDLAVRADAELAPPAVEAAETGLAATGVASTTLSTLGGVANELVPTPAATLVGTGSTTSGVTEQGQNRNPTQESKGQEGVTTPTTATIQIVIRRPGGGD